MPQCQNGGCGSIHSCSSRPPLMIAFNSPNRPKFSSEPKSNCGYQVALEESLRQQSASPTHALELEFCHDETVTSTSASTMEDDDLSTLSSCSSSIYTIDMEGLEEIGLENNDVYVDDSDNEEEEDSDFARENFSVDSSSLASVLRMIFEEEKDESDIDEDGNECEKDGRHSSCVRSNNHAANEVSSWHEITSELKHEDYHHHDEERRTSALSWFSIAFDSDPPATNES